MSEQPGRVCPLRYRYGAHAIAQAPSKPAETLYVIGGLYGNLPALNAIEQLALCESGPVTLCFNGDFNWFNVDDFGFREINERVLCHDAVLGNVGAELASASPDTGCGCAYPDSVDAATVERSNRIHARLLECALRHPDLRARLARTPMFARYQVGELTVGIVHGDAESLAGWRFDPAALDATEGMDWLTRAAHTAQVDLFASSHTCLPALRVRNGLESGSHAIINNGAAGMPNFAGKLHGVISRIATTPAPQQALYGTLIAGVHVDALAVAYDPAAWQAAFLGNWPAGSDAYRSYFKRITEGADWTVERAAGR